MHHAWVVAVDMGYGHQRAAWPLRHLSPTGGIINANSYPGIPESDKKVWQDSRLFYEFFSRLSNIPAIGKSLFAAFDYVQRIKPFYPHRDLSEPTMQVRENYFAIHHGFGKHLIDYLNTENIPLITTFFTVAFAAEEHGFKNDIYVVICDSDVSRAWVPLRPRDSRIKYFAPCNRVVDRLKLYGVPPENIFLTGFPLPEENIGPELSAIKKDVAERITNLDPEHRFRDKYGKTAQAALADLTLTERHHHPITLTFAVGGAGAQMAIASSILKSLKGHLLRGQITLHLVAGVRQEVANYFHDQIAEQGLETALNRTLFILIEKTKPEYFASFNKLLRTSDVLWTKPSELVFYSGLGLPIIMAPSLGSQEDYNRTWLKTIGAGISQNNPKYTHEWLFDWVNSGWLAEAALSGFLDGRQYGVKNITNLLFNTAAKPLLDHSLV